MNEALFMGQRSLRATLSMSKVARAQCYISTRNVSSFAGANTVGQSKGPAQAISVASTGQSHNGALAKLPLSHVLRSYFIMSMSSSDLLLKTTMGIIQRMLNAKSALFDPDRNRALNWLFRKTFYDQFCAGETKAEIQQVIGYMHSVGFDGIILEYAPEVLDRDDGSMTESQIQQGIDSWKSGILSTIDVVNPGDFVGLKWSGMGPEALRLMKQDQPPSSSMENAMVEVCDAAKDKGVKLLPAAEPQNAQRAVDAWSSRMAIKYNKLEPNKAVVYHTFQCYLKHNAQNLAKQLAYAAEHNFTLGVKLVRGAYLWSEQRDLIWDTKAETDQAYDNLAESLLNGKYTETLQPADPSKPAFPGVNIMLATHNEDSVLKAHQVLARMDPKQKPQTRVDFGQLYGMADEVSCKLLSVQASTSKQENSNSKIYKCVTWGTVTECLNYLMRRATENKDALTRTVHTRKAMGSELLRRFRRTFLRMG